MHIEKPIFIMASPRSGTTILYNLFTRHRDTAFPEHFADKYYLQPWKFKILPLMVKQQMRRYKIRPLPHEGLFLSKFFQFGKPLTENNVSKEIRSYIYSLIKAELKAFNAKRFVCKQVDFSMRIRFLNALFPDAYYIVIWREPRAVIGSLFTQMSGEWKAKNHEQRGWLQITDDFDKNEPLIESCIKFYERYSNSLKNEIEVIKDHVIEIDYENFVCSPKNELKRLYDYTELYWYDALDKEIPDQLDLNANKKWLNLPAEVKTVLEKKFLQK